MEWLPRTQCTTEGGPRADLLVPPSGITGVAMHAYVPCTLCTSMNAMMLATAAGAALIQLILPRAMHKHSVVASSVPALHMHSMLLLEAPAMLLIPLCPVM